MKKTILNESQLLKEGTSNFGNMGNLPLYVFYTYDEVMYNMENSDDYPKEDDFYDEDGNFDEDAYSSAVEKFEDEYWQDINVCVLDEDEQYSLNKRLGELNSALKDKSDELEDEAYERDHDDNDEDIEGISIDEYNDLMDKAGLFDDLATFEVKSGYYSAAYIDNDYPDSFDKLDEESKKFILDELKKIKKDFGLTQMEISWGPASNGETGYSKVEDESLKEDIDEYDADFAICCEDVSNTLGAGYWHGMTSSERRWGLSVNGGDGNQFSPRFADVITNEISYPVSDGYFNYGGLDVFLTKDAVKDIDDEILKNDLLSVGCDEEDIKKFIKGEINEIEFFIDYEIDIDDYEDEEDEDIEESLNESPVYDLSPRYDSRQSFYGKARVDTGSKGDQNKLYSYGTLVAEIKNGKPVVYGTYSSTTLRHIKDWLKQNGFKADSLAQIQKDYMQEGYDKKLDEAKIIETTGLGEFKLGNTSYYVEGEISDTRDYRREEVRIYEMKNYKVIGYGMYKWLNRPWYRFQYASAFRNAFVDAFGNKYYEFIDGIIESSSSVKECCDKVTANASLMDELDYPTNESVDGTPHKDDYAKAVKKHKDSNKKGSINNLFQLGGDPKKSMEVFNKNMDVTPNASVSEGGEACCEGQLNEKMTDSYESDHFLAKCEFKPGKYRNYFYVHLIDKDNNKEYAKGTYGWINRPWEKFDYASALLDACRKYGLSDEKIDALRKYNTFDATLKAFDEMVNSKDESLKEDKDEERVSAYQSKIDALNVSDDEYKKVIKIADDYESKAQRGFITYTQMDEIANAMGLKDMSDNELARAWKVYYYILSKEAFSDDNDSIDKWKKYSDAASAFAEVINREARERKATGNYAPEKGESLTSKEDIEKGIKRGINSPNTIKIKPNSKNVSVEIPDKSKAGEEGNPIQQGLRGRVNKLEGLKESTNKDYNKLFLDFLNDTEFELVKCDDTNRKSTSAWDGTENEGSWGLNDLQGGNLGDIESDRFESACDILDRMDAYIEDYYLEPLEEGGYEGTDNLGSCEEWVNWYNTIGKEKYGEELSSSEFDMLDMIANHCQDVDLEKVYELQGGKHSEVGTSVYIIMYKDKDGNLKSMYQNGKEIALHCDEATANKLIDAMNKYDSTENTTYVLRKESYAPEGEYVVWEKDQIEDEIDDTILKGKAYDWEDRVRDNHQQIVDWLYEHEQATQDALSHFNKETLEEIDIYDLVDWIDEHNELSNDFFTKFNFKTNAYTE